MKHRDRCLALIVIVANLALAASAGAAAGSGSTSGESAKLGSATVAARTKVKKPRACKKNCAPTVMISVSPAKVRVGQTATLTWSATGATSCMASESWSGVQAASGSLPVTPGRGGRAIYTLSCTSGSAATSASAVLAVPLPVLSSSYENRMAAGDPANGAGAPDITGGGNNYTPLPGQHPAWADFFQEGDYSLILASDERDSRSAPVANIVGHFYIFKFRNGRYEDHTAELLKDTTACLGGPAKALVADFNGDGTPDLYQTCGGIDIAEAVGDQDRLLLSQPDGSYSNIVVPGVGKHHGATAADLNGDGLPDVLGTDVARFRIDPPRQARVLINNGDGTFRSETQRLPGFLVGKNLTTFELIDTGRGVRDLFVGGSICGQDPRLGCPANWLLSSLLILNDGNGSFANSQVIVLPNPPGESGIVYGHALEFVYVGGNLYTLQISGDWDATIRGSGAVIVHRFNLTTQEYGRAYEHRGPFTPDSDTIFPHMVSWGDGTMHAHCVRIRYDKEGGVCAVSFPL